VGKGVSVVLVIIGGRPLEFNPEGVDAVMMAWLPGSECHAVAEVLVGVEKPTGRLPVGVPPFVKIKDEVRDLYTFGNGLTYE